MAQSSEKKSPRTIDAMMVKITTGASFAGAIMYDHGMLGKQQEYEVIGYEGVDMGYDKEERLVPNVQDIARSFEMQASLNPKVSNPVKHFAVSWPPEDADKLTNEVMMEAVKAHLKGMGYENTQYPVTRHYGTDNPHCHVVVNVVDNDGHRISDSMERKRNAAVCKEITKDMGFSWGISFSKQVKDENGKTITCRFSGSKIDRKFTCRNLEKIINVWHKFPSLRAEAKNILNLHAEIKDTHRIPPEVQSQCKELGRQMWRLGREEQKLQKNLPKSIAKGALEVMMAINLMDPIGALVAILSVTLVLAFKNNKLERIRDQRADLAQDIKDIRQTFRPDKAPDSPQQKTQGLKLH